MKYSEYEFFRKASRLKKITNHFSQLLRELSPTDYEKPHVIENLSKICLSECTPEILASLLDYILITTAHEVCYVFDSNQYQIDRRSFQARGYLTFTDLVKRAYPLSLTGQDVKKGQYFEISHLAKYFLLMQNPDEKLLVSSRSEDENSKLVKTIYSPLTLNIISSAKSFYNLLVWRQLLENSAALNSGTAREFFVNIAAKMVLAYKNLEACISMMSAHFFRPIPEESKSWEELKILCDALINKDGAFREIRSESTDAEQMAENTIKRAKLREEIDALKLSLNEKIKQLESPKEIINIRDMKGMTLLHYAVRGHSRSCVEALLFENENELRSSIVVDIPDHEGKIPFMHLSSTCLYPKIAQLEYRPQMPYSKSEGFSLYSATESYFRHIMNLPSLNLGPNPEAFRDRIEQLKSEKDKERNNPREEAMLSSLAEACDVFIIVLRRNLTDYKVEEYCPTSGDKSNQCMIFLCREFDGTFTPLYYAFPQSEKKTANDESNIQDKLKKQDKSKLKAQLGMSPSLLRVEKLLESPKNLEELFQRACAIRGTLGELNNPEKRLQPEHKAQESEQAIASLFIQFLEASRDSILTVSDENQKQELHKIYLLLGFIYEAGYGVSREYLKAALCYHKAIQDEVSPSANALKRLVKLKKNGILSALIEEANDTNRGEILKLRVNIKEAFDLLSKVRADIWAIDLNKKFTDEGVFKDLILAVLGSGYNRHQFYLVKYRQLWTQSGESEEVEKLERSVEYWRNACMREDAFFDAIISGLLNGDYYQILLGKGVLSRSKDKEREKKLAEELWSLFFYLDAIFSSTNTEYTEYIPSTFSGQRTVIHNALRVRHPITSSSNGVSTPMVIGDCTRSTLTPEPQRRSSASGINLQMSRRPSGSLSASSSSSNLSSSRDSSRSNDNIPVNPSPLEGEFASSTSPSANQSDSSNNSASSVELASIFSIINEVETRVKTTNIDTPVSMITEQQKASAGPCKPPFLMPDDVGLVVDASNARDDLKAILQDEKRELRKKVEEKLALFKENYLAEMTSGDENSTRHYIEQAENDVLRRLGVVENTIDKQIEGLEHNAENTINALLSDPASMSVIQDCANGEWMGEKLSGSVTDGVSDYLAAVCKPIDSTVFPCLSNLQRKTRAQLVEENQLMKKLEKFGNQYSSCLKKGTFAEVFAEGLLLLKKSYQDSNTLKKNCIDYMNALSRDIRWLNDLLTIRGINRDEYIAELDQISWTPEREGRILCDYHDVVCHIIDLMGIERQYFIIGNQIKENQEGEQPLNAAVIEIVKYAENSYGLLMLSPLAMMNHQAEQGKREAEQAKREAEQAKREAEQAKREAEQAKREAEQATHGRKRVSTSMTEKELRKTKEEKEQADRHAKILADQLRVKAPARVVAQAAVFDTQTPFFHSIQPKPKPAATYEEISETDGQPCFKITIIYSRLDRTQSDALQELLKQAQKNGAFVKATVDSRQYIKELYFSEKEAADDLLEEILTNVKPIPQGRKVAP